MITITRHKDTRYGKELSESLVTHCLIIYLQNAGEYYEIAYTNLSFLKFEPTVYTELLQTDVV